MKRSKKLTAPSYFVSLVKCITRVSEETMKIVNIPPRLPAPFMLFIYLLPISGNWSFLIYPLGSHSMPSGINSHKPPPKRQRLFRYGLRPVSS